jgi:hypothetical protein
MLPPRSCMQRRRRGGGTRGNLLGADCRATCERQRVMEQRHLYAFHGCIAEATDAGSHSCWHSRPLPAATAAIGWRPSPQDVCSRPERAAQQGETDGGRRQTAHTSASQSECSPRVQERLRCILGRQAWPSSAAASGGSRDAKREELGGGPSARYAVMRVGESKKGLGKRAARAAGPPPRLKGRSPSCGDTGRAAAATPPRGCSSALRCQDGMAEPRK